MVLGDRDLLLILEFFTIVMYGECRGNWAENPVAKYYLSFEIRQIIIDIVVDGRKRHLPKNSVELHIIGSRGNARMADCCFTMFCK